MQFRELIAKLSVQIIKVRERVYSTDFRIHSFAVLVLSLNLIPTLPPVGERKDYSSLRIINFLISLFPIC